MTTIKYATPLLAHATQCPDVPADATVVVTSALLTGDRLARYHSCIGYPYSPPTRVAVTEAADAPHPYEPSCIWPAGESRPRCIICRGTHPGEHHWLHRVSA